MFRNPIVSIESFVKRDNVIPFHNNLFMYLNIVYRITKMSKILSVFMTIHTKNTAE